MVINDYYGKFDHGRVTTSVLNRLKLKIENFSFLFLPSSLGKTIETNLGSTNGWGGAEEGTGSE